MAPSKHIALESLGVFYVYSQPIPSAAAMLRKGRWLPSPAMVTTPAVVVLERGACRNTSVPANLWGSWASWGSNGWTDGQNKQSTVHFSAQGCGCPKKPEFKATSLRWILVDQGTLIWMETNGNQLVFSHACFICKIPSYTLNWETNHPYSLRDSNYVHTDQNWAPIQRNTRIHTSEIHLSHLYSLIIVAFSLTLFHDRNSPAFHRKTPVDSQ